MGAVLVVALVATPAWAAAPDAPSAPTVTGGDGQILVTYAAPSDNGSQITDYLADCTSSNGGTSETGDYATPDGSASPITVTGLTNGDTYTCTVTATNADGQGTSPGSDSVVVGAPLQPVPPTVSAGDAQIVVTYVAPANNGSQITDYLADCTSSNGGTSGTGDYATPDGSASPIAVTGLTNGDTYTCTVTATNSLGPSPASPASTTAIPAGVPAPPAQPTVVAANAQILVTYAAPANNGSAILSYAATCTSTNGGATGTGTYTTPDGSASPITVAGLTNADTYTCTVIATNSLGPSPASPASTTAIPAGVPAPPAQPTVVAANAQILVTYAAPANNGSAILSYAATCTSTNGGATGTGTYTTPDGSASPITVAGLTNADTYTCTVIATNSVGPSPASPASAAAVPTPGVPSAPVQPTVSDGDAQIVVTYAEPANNGSAILSYAATCTSTNGGATGTGTYTTPDGSASPITVAGLTNGDTYTCTVIATNSLGPSPASPASTALVVGVPNQPAQPTVVAANAQIVVTYLAPANNGNPILSYAATCTSTNGGATGTGTYTTPDGSASPITVAGLTNADTYTCTVIATNSVGPSPASPASAAAVPTPGVPSAPAQPTVSDGDAQIVVTYAEPANNGSAILSYAATCTSSNGGATGTGTYTTPDGSASPITVAGLTNGDTYTCTVIATNSLGPSPASPASTALVVGVPNQPAQPTVVAANAQIVVTYLAPADGGSAITSFTATCTSTNGGATGTGTYTTPDGSASPITVTGLTNGDTYTCTVIATNSAGNSAASPSSGPAVPAAVPDAPAQPTATAGNERIAVTFVAPNSNGNAITGFTATCASSDGGTPGAKSLTGPTVVPIVVDNLTNGDTYTCSVTATNAAGTSPASAPSAPAVPAAAPAPPTISDVASGDGALTVSFAPNSDNGNAITTFTAVCSSTNGGINGSMSGPSSPLTVSPLSNGNVYVCDVTATNAIGASAASATSETLVVGQPGPPSILPVVSKSAPGLSGSLKVSFHPGPANAGAILLYRATCTPVSRGVTRSATGTVSPITVSNLLSGHAYSCVVTATNFFGTSVASGAAIATVGTPAPPDVIAVLPLAHGIAIVFSPPSDNGHAILNYRGGARRRMAALRPARCSTQARSWWTI